MRTPPGADTVGVPSCGGPLEEDETGLSKNACIEQVLPADDDERTVKADPDGQTMGLNEYVTDGNV